MYSRIADSACARVSKRWWLDHFIFKAAPEALDGGVIIAIALSRHGSHQAVFLENSAIHLSAILAAAVRVMDQSRWGTLIGSKEHAEGAENPRDARMILFWSYRQFLCMSVF